MPAEDFQAALSEQRRSEGDAAPVSFTLAGEVFECGPAKLPPWTVLKLQAADERNVTEAAQAVTGFFRTIVKGEDWRRFEEAAETVEDDETLMGAVGDVIEAYTARPTRRPSVSPAGPSSTGVSSTPGSSLTVASPGAVPFSRARAV